MKLDKLVGTPQPTQSSQANTGRKTKQLGGTGAVANLNNVNTELNNINTRNNLNNADQMESNGYIQVHYAGPAGAPWQVSIINSAAHAKPRFAAHAPALALAACMAYWFRHAR